MERYGQVAVLGGGGQHRRPAGWIRAGRRPGVQDAHAVVDLVRLFVGVSGDTDGVGAAVFPDRGGDAVLVADSVAGAVGDDELDAPTLHRRHVGQVDVRRVDVPPNAGERATREGSHLVDHGRRLEVPGVDDVIDRLDPLTHPVGNPARSSGNVRVADDRQLHTPSSSRGVKSLSKRKGRVVSLRRATMPHVVTCFLRHRTHVLLARRNDAVGTDAGRWAGISGPVEGDPTDAEADARREIREETGVESATLVRVGDPLDVRDGDRTWTVHPFLFEVGSRDIDPNEGLDAHEWASPPAIHDRETVPGLWNAYVAVAPTVETVAADGTHGSAWISVRALEVLRDRAAVAGTADAVVAVARDLRAVRPSMAAVANRVNRVMADADRTPAAIRERAQRAAAAALDADDAAAARAAERCGASVATLSRSGTVRAALRAAEPSVLIGESRPAREGVEVAVTLTDDGLDVTLTTDAALSSELAVRDPEIVLVGADAVLADGSVVNKVGTRGLAIAAAREDVPVYAVAAADKVRPDERFEGEAGADADLYDGAAPVTVSNPTFDRTPPDLVAGVITERGVLDAAGVGDVAAEHETHARWDEGDD